MPITEPNHPLYRIQDLTRQYPLNDLPTFSWLNVIIKPWSFTFLLGESGVGKTTLTKCLIRQLQPPVWTVYFKGDDIARFSVSEVQAYRRSIGVIFQDWKLLNHKTVRENIAFPLALDGVDSEEIQSRVKETAQHLSIDHLLSKYPHALSGGEQQRVAIARASIRKNQVLIADEPTWNIDQEASQKVAQQCITLNTEWTAIVFITHDQSLIDYINQQIQTETIRLHR